MIGKGTKQRTVPIPDVLTTALDHYLHEVRPTLADSPLLFTNPYGQQGGQPLTGRALLDLCRRAGANASITGPHTALCCGTPTPPCPWPAEWTCTSSLDFLVTPE